MITEVNNSPTTGVFTKVILSSRLSESSQKTGKKNVPGHCRGGATTQGVTLDDETPAAYISTLDTQVVKCYTGR